MAAAACRSLTTRCRMDILTNMSSQRHRIAALVATRMYTLSNVQTFPVPVCPMNKRFHVGVLSTSSSVSMKATTHGLSYDSTSSSSSSTKGTSHVHVNVFRIDGLPVGITGHELINYFKTYGDVRCVRIGIDPDYSYGYGYNYVYGIVCFTKGSIVRSPTIDHKIRNNNVRLENIAVKYPDRWWKAREEEKSQIILSGLAEDTTVEDVRNYFKQIGPINRVYVYDTNGVRNGFGKVSFKNIESAVKADGFHTVGASEVKARLLYILNEDERIAPPIAKW